VPMQSSRCDVALSIIVLKTTGSRAGPLNLHFYVAHPAREWQKRHLAADERR
jgi:hypothetical protein